MLAAILFLSCLYGSERKYEEECDWYDFLSCLYGSELRAGLRRDDV